jgi:hypothetical protein
VTESEFGRCSRIEDQPIDSLISGQDPLELLGFDGGNGWIAQPDPLLQATENKMISGASLMDHH